MLARSSIVRASARRVFTRCVSSTGPIPVDVDHYVSGWNIDDIADFIKPGAYHIQTYNKISPKVSDHVDFHLNLFRQLRRHS